MDFNCFIQFLTKFSEIDEHVTDLTAKRWVDLKIYIDENMTALSHQTLTAFICTKFKLDIQKLNEPQQELHLDCKSGTC